MCQTQNLPIVCPTLQENIDLCLFVLTLKLAYFYCMNTNLTDKNTQGALTLIGGTGMS